jgi:hypothetical protein
LHGPGDALTQTMPVNISTPEQYRAAIAEAQKLEGAAEGSCEFRYRQELLAALQDYELDHLADPNCRPGRPAGSI